MGWLCRLTHQPSVFATRYTAKVPQVERSQALTLQYDKVVFILEPSEQAKAAIGKGVTVVDDPPWPLSFRYKAVELAYRTFDNVR